ncbi:DUF4328 domain-containing protein [Kitasatospora sp. NPDC057542]|uniref:DUF4328 domain-containing protein n=1 Tax=Kitasatospora sp. NPDC057542 TaxID=3346162 RepID=UPI0036A11EBC
MRGRRHWTGGEQHFLVPRATRPWAGAGRRPAGPGCSGGRRPRRGGPLPGAPGSGRRCAGRPASRIGAWFTPVVLLWFPWQLMVDCWRASAPLDAEGRRRTPSEKVLVVWWSTWIGSLIVARIAGAMGRVDPLVPGDLESLRNAIRVEAAGSALRLVAAVAAIVVVNRLTAMQQARRADVNPLAAQAAQAQALVQSPAAAAAPATTHASAEAPRDAGPESQPPA